MDDGSEAVLPDRTKFQEALLSKAQSASSVNALGKLVQKGKSHEKPHDPAKSCSDEDENESGDEDSDSIPETDDEHVINTRFSYSIIFLHFSYLTTFGHRTPMRRRKLRKLQKGAGHLMMLGSLKRTKPSAPWTPKL